MTENKDLGKMIEELKEFYSDENANEQKIAKLEKSCSPSVKAE